MAPANYALLTTHNEAFASIAAVSGYSATLNGDRPDKIQGRRVTHNVLDVLGVNPAVGRGFRPEGDIPGAARVAPDAREPGASAGRSRITWGSGWAPHPQKDHH